MAPTNALLRPLAGVMPSLAAMGPKALAAEALRAFSSAPASGAPQVPRTKAEPRRGTAPKLFSAANGPDTVHAVDPAHPSVLAVSQVTRDYANYRKAYTSFGF